MTSDAPAKTDAPWARPAARTIFAVLAWAFVAAVVVQVFLAGLAVTHDASYWGAHAAFVHVFEVVALVMAGLAGWGRAPRRFLWLALAIFGLIWLQYAFIRFPFTWVRAFHPVNALAIFGVGAFVALGASRRSPTRAMPLALLLAGVLLAGCVDEPDMTPTVPEKDEQGRYVIRVGPDGRQAFSPAHAVVPVGATVVWVQESGVHHVLADDASFTNGGPAPDAWTYERTFDAPGEHPYACKPHRAAGMKGQITVTEA